MVAQTPPDEIIRACYPTFPGDRELSFADTSTAKWMSDDAIEFLLHHRRYITDSWFGAMLTRTLVCRHRNWKYACEECKAHTVNTLENYLSPKRKEPDRL